MQLPEYPRLPTDFLTVPLTSQLLLVAGGYADITLRGKSVSTILPALMPLLNGRLTIKEIAGRLPNYSEQAVRDTITLLYMRGILEEGRTYTTNITKEKLQWFKPQLDFYSRYTDVTRYSRNRLEVLERLQHSRIALVANSPAAYELATGLVELGIGQLNIVLLNATEADARWTALKQASPFTQVQFYDGGLSACAQPEAWLVGQNMLLFVGLPWDGSTIRHLNQLALAYKVILQCGLFDNGTIEIGHVYYPDQSPCYECANLQGALNLQRVGPHDMALPHDSDCIDFVAETRLGVGFMTLSVLTTLTRLTPPADSTVNRLSLKTLAWETQTLYKILACPVCGQVEDYDGRDFAIGHDHEENLPAFYHANARVRKQVMFPKGHQVHYRDEVVKTVRNAYKAYDGRLRIALPEMGAMPASFEKPYTQMSLGTQPLHKQPLSFDAIGKLMRLVGGATTLKHGDFAFHKRITPSGGNMLSQSLYLINFDLPEVSPGIYYFHQDGYLEQIKTGRFSEPVLGAVLQREGMPERPHAAIVITSCMARIESKYGGRAFFFSMVDSGVMLHSLQYVSGLFGVELWQAFEFVDDDIHNMLELYTSNEIVSAITFLY
jgi:SagB-type dehydrogenase family enzyme